MIDPETYFDDFNIRIHGINEECVKGKPTFPDVWPSILPYFGNKDIVNLVFAHNATFDMKAIILSLWRYDLHVPFVSFGCSLAISRRVWPGEPSYSLTNLCRKLNIKEGGHDAGEDSRACAELIMKAAELKGVNFAKEVLADDEIDDIENKLQFCFGYFDDDDFCPSVCQRLKRYNKPRVIVGDESKRNPDSIFFEKNVVFTGKLSSMMRSDAQQIIADIGGFCQNDVSSKTNILVVGQQDYRLVGEDGLSNKQEKALKLLAKGADIEILSEEEFLRSL